MAANDTWVSPSKAAEMIGVPEVEVIDWAEYGFITAWRCPEKGWCIAVGAAEEFAESAARYRANRDYRTRRKDRQQWEPESWRIGSRATAEELRMPVSELTRLAREYEEQVFGARRFKGQWFFDGEWVAHVAGTHQDFEGKRGAEVVWAWIQEYHRTNGE